jgi:hypothetical protein
MAKDNEVGAGKDVLSYCGKCKMPLAHTIISLTKKGTVDKCECKTCGATHKYRDPDKPVKPRAAGKRAPKKPAASSEELWNQAVADAKGISMPYKMSGEFSEGSLIDHATFGKGVVEEIVDHNKIKVIFEEGAMVLIHKRD